MYLWRLECFRALAQELNFTRAAERLHTSQPALSRQIKAFEKDVGAQLFTRSGGTALTPFGEDLLPDVVEILERVEALQSKLAVQQTSTNLRLRVLYGRSIDSHIVSEIVSEYKEAYPHIQFESEIAWTSYNVDLLENDKADIAFVRLPLQTQDADIHTMELGQEPLVLAVPTNSQLAREKHITARQLRNIPLIHWPRRQAPGSFDATMEAIFGGTKVTLSNTEPSTELRLRAVRANQGSAIVTADALDGRTAGVESVPIVDLAWAFGIAWKSTSKQHIEEFLRIAKSRGEA